MKSKSNKNNSEDTHETITESVGAPKMRYASEDAAALGTNAGGKPVSGKPVSGKPKKD